MKYIQSGDFCEIVSDKFSEEFGVKRGHIVYVAGHKALPISEEDPYTQRVKFLVHLYDDQQKRMGKEIYLMDANSILPLDEKIQEKMLKKYKYANGID